MPMSLSSVSICLVTIHFSISLHPSWVVSWRILIFHLSLINSILAVDLVSSMFSSDFITDVDV